MKAVLMSIQPKWVEKIVSGEKTIEVRKTRPKLETPFKCYIYCTKPSKKYQTICGCMVINTDELYRLPSGKIKHDWSGELMCCNGEYTKDNFLNGKVIGEFVCDKIAGEGETIRGCTGFSMEELQDYCDGKDIYGWHISDLKIYDKPKELSEFKHDTILHTRFNGYKEPITRPPQSWCYVEELQNG